MKIKENVTLYICEHCKKEMKTLKGMTRHEGICNKNPKNIRICHGCGHLEEREIDVSYCRYDREVEANAKAFYCKKLKTLVYPYIVERKNLVNEYPETFEDQIPMKKECKDFIDPWEIKDE